MGREVRMVPPGWKHPTYGEHRNNRESIYYCRATNTPQRQDTSYMPLYDEDYETASREWIAEFIDWHVHGIKLSDYSENYWEYAGNPPDEAYYRPKWEDSERTHFMMYEDTSEGTPISPAFATPEELARWLADTDASAFAGETASYEAWLRIAKGGWAPSAVVEDGVMKSGVQALADHPTRDSVQLTDKGE